MYQHPELFGVVRIGLPIGGRAAVDAARGRAVVIGGSVGGMLAARALADHYERVTVIERDVLPEADVHRRAVPQGRHGHVLLTRGIEVVESLLPGLSEELVADGAPTYASMNDSYISLGGHVFARAAVGRTAITASRPFFEGHIRRRVLALPNVELREGEEVVALASTAGHSRVTGVTLRDDAGAEEKLGTDLVVVASGRSARLPAWLETLGYGRPTESTLRIDLTYVSRLFRMAPGAMADRIVLVGARAGKARGMGLFAQEDDTWLLTLVGYGKERPPTDHAGFRRFFAGVAPPHAGAAIEAAEPVGEIAAFGFPAHRRRHYERMRRFPAGLIPIGDAICSFNPTYGQGMTVAALEAEALRACLSGGDGQLRRRYDRAVVKVVDHAWGMATGTDLVLPEIEGRRNLSTRLATAYTHRLRRAAETDGEVAASFLRVAGMLEPPSHTLRPTVLRRVLARRKPASTVWPGHGLPTPIERRTLRVGAISTPLRESGPRELDEAAVFVHGVPGAGADFEPLISAVGRFGRALAWDAPGFGRADKPRCFDHTVDGHAAFLARAIDELGVRRAHLVLHGFGGPWGLAWAAANLERLASVTLICTGVPLARGSHLAARIWRTPLLGELAMATLTRAAFGLGLRGSGRPPLPGPLVDRMYEDLDGDTRRAILRLYRAAVRPGAAEHLIERFRLLDPPTLVIWGGRDSCSPVAQAVPQTRAFPSARVHVLDGSGHWPFIDDDARCAELISAHLRRAMAPAGDASPRGRDYIAIGEE